MARFPSSFVDDLKAQADIVQVVQDYVPLKKAGSAYKGLCPFHTEKTPSFHVHQEKGFFHCFGCGAGGDVVKFVELQEKLAFPEAVRQLAHRFGLRVPDSGDAERDAAADAERESLLALHELSAGFFRDQLQAPAGAAARAVLARRAITQETIDRLGLGYAPPQRDRLTRHLRDAGHAIDRIVASGLAVERGGDVVDRFRNRLMIPISRDGGSIVAFGGRALEPGQQPKYVNSPETALYAKSRTLYGLHLTKAAIRRLGYAVLVEGYFDFAQALQAGVATAVAVCGTALTPQQCRLLHRFASKVIVSFDPDAAGEGAAARSGELLLTEGFQVNVATLAPGEDPDTCVRRHGGAHYVGTLKASRPFLEHVVERAAARRDLTRDAHRRIFLKDMLAVAARIPDAAARDQFADRVAHRARVMEDVVRTEIRRAAVARRTTLRPDVAERGAPTAMTQAEKGLIWGALRNPAATQPVLAGLEPEDVEALATRSILLVARTLADWPADSVPATLLERLSEDDAQLAARIGQEPEPPTTQIDDCGIELRRRRYERERAALQYEIDQRQRLGTDDALREIDVLWMRKKDLIQRIDALGK